MRFRATVMSGAGIATSATQLDWFRSTVLAVGGFDPVPGTLNLRVEDEASWNRLLLESGTVLVPPTQKNCCALLLGVRIGLDGGFTRDGIVVRPLTAGYAPSQVEVVAGVHLRSEFGLRDGDRVQLQVEALPGPRWVQAPPRGGAGATASGRLTERIALRGADLPLEAFWVATDDGVMVAILGGRPHLGAVAQAVPRPSLVDPQRRSSTSSVLTLPVHKDDVAARMAAELLAVRLGQNVAVAAGIHVGPAGQFKLGPEELESVLEGVRRLAERVAEAAPGGRCRNT